MNTGTSLPTGPVKPGKVQTIAIMTMANGILNIIWGLGTIAGLHWTIVCWPFGAFPLVLGILEIIYATKLLSNTSTPLQPARYIAVMEICDILYGNAISLVVGIVVMVLYNDPEVKAFYAALPA